MGDRELCAPPTPTGSRSSTGYGRPWRTARLKMEEFTERMGLAYQAVTYGDLAKVVADLPPASPQPGPRLAPAPADSPAAAAKRSVFANIRHR